MIAGRRQRRVKTVEAMPAIYWTCPFSKAKTRETSREGRSYGNQVDAALAGGGSVDCVVCASYPGSAVKNWFGHATYVIRQ